MNISSLACHFFPVFEYAFQLEAHFLIWVCPLGHKSGEGQVEQGGSEWQLFVYTVRLPESWRRLSIQFGA